MGKTRDLFKKTGDTQGNISCKDGHNKGQKYYGPNKNRLRSGKKKKKRSGKNTQKNYTKKIFMTQITMMVWSLT